MNLFQSLAIEYLPIKKIICTRVVKKYDFICSQIIGMPPDRLAPHTLTIYYYI